MGYIVSGMTSLGKNTCFPALLVTIGHFSKIEKILPSLSWNDLANSEFRFRPKDIGKIFHSAIDSVWDALVNKTEGIDQLHAKAISFDPIASLSTLETVVSKHSVAIVTAGAIGASTTIIDALFKRMPFTSQINPYLRLAISIGTASMITVGAADTLGYDIDPQTLLDIAIKVGIVGSMAKVTNRAIWLSLTAIRNSSDCLAMGVRGVCNSGISICNVFNWGSLPKKLEPVPPKQKLEDAKKDDKAPKQDLPNAQKTVAKTPAKQNTTQVTAQRKDSPKAVPKTPSTPNITKAKTQDQGSPNAAQKTSVQQNTTPLTDQNQDSLEVPLKENTTQPNIPTPSPSKPPSVWDNFSIKHVFNPTKTQQKKEIFEPASKEQPQPSSPQPQVTSPLTSYTGSKVKLISQEDASRIFDEKTKTGSEDEIPTDYTLGEQEEEKDLKLNDDLDSNEVSEESETSTLEKNDSSDVSESESL